MRSEALILVVEMGREPWRRVIAGI